MTTVTHINPPDLHTNPAFSHGVLFSVGPMIVVGGQNGTDSPGATRQRRSR